MLHVARHFIIISVYICVHFHICCEFATCIYAKLVCNIWHESAERWTQCWIEHENGYSSRINAIHSRAAQCKTILLHLEMNLQTFANDCSMLVFIFMPWDLVRLCLISAYITDLQGEGMKYFDTLYGRPLIR